VICFNPRPGKPAMVKIPKDHWIMAHYFRTRKTTFLSLGYLQTQKSHLWTIWSQCQPKASFGSWSNGLPRAHGPLSVMKVDPVARVHSNELRMIEIKTSTQSDPDDNRPRSICGCFRCCPFNQLNINSSPSIIIILIVETIY
jgi:hypothetical protein